MALPETMDMEEEKLQRFTSWLRMHGATFPSLEIRTENGMRGVYAKEALVDGQLAFHIPRQLIVTKEVAKEALVQRGILAADSPIHHLGCLAAFLLYSRDKNGFFKPYVDILPNEFPSLRMFCKHSHLMRLKGSHILSKVAQYQFLPLVRHDYECIKPHFPSLSFREFALMFSAVQTRNFALEVDGCGTVGMVPLADMLNHASPTPTLWNQRATNGFTNVAVQHINKGSEVFDSYGKGCNSRLLVVYGFCTENNPWNLVEIELQETRPQHPFFRYVAGWGEHRRDRRVFSILQAGGHEETRRMFSYLRLSCQEDMAAIRQAITVADNPAVLPFISVRNEVAALNALSAACKRSLERYDTTLEEDENLLADPALSWTMRFAVMIGCGEKRILHHYLELSKVAIDVLQGSDASMNFTLAEECGDGKPFADYFNDLAGAFNSNR